MYKLVKYFEVIVFQIQNVFQLHFAWIIISVIQRNHLACANVSQMFKDVQKKWMHWGWREEETEMTKSVKK